MHVGVAHDLAELLKVDLAVVVLVGEEDGLVDDLLELGVLQVGAHHHLEHLEQLAVADVAVVVNVVDPGKEKVISLSQFRVIFIAAHQNKAI